MLSKWGNHILSHVTQKKKEEGGVTVKKGGEKEAIREGPN